MVMGTQCISSQMKEEIDGPAVPPGFPPLTSFTLQRVEGRDATANSSTCTALSLSLSLTVGDTDRFRKSLRHRPWVNYSEFDNSSGEDDSDSELPPQDVPSVSSCLLPKGVIRGCSECANCQKVVARWRPDGACRPVIHEAPAFHPTEQEFKDPIKYIESIRPSAEPYGICRIVPPPSWKPPCLLKEKNLWENSKFATRVQQIDKLQNRETLKNMCQNHDIMMKRKKRKLLNMQQGNRERPGEETDQLMQDTSIERFGFLPGPDFTLAAFQKYADQFKEQYFNSSEPAVEAIEGEYWRIVQRPTEAIEVLYGADLDTASFGSGFPKNETESTEYGKSGWNLNNIGRVPGSVLCFEDGNIPGVLVPWLYVGMSLSSFCWHVEDHHLYSLNYLHMGAPKVWYGVPGNMAVKLEQAMKKHLPHLFEEQPDLLHNLVTQFSPSLLKVEGVVVHRCVQREGEFVLTFPRAYHSGFNCGFNCAEAVNVAPVDWLPHGQNAVEIYREQRRKITLSHDKLLLGSARESVRAQWNILFLKNSTPDNLRWKRVSGPDGILTKTFKARVSVENTRREHLCLTTRSRKMDTEFDVTDRECVVCHYDLYLSAAGCSCCREKFACLIHAKELCCCDWSTRYFLFRYDSAELNTLFDALGGKLSSVHKWAISDLGLSLTSCLTRDRSPHPATPPVNSGPGDKGSSKGIQVAALPVATASTISPLEMNGPSLHSVPVVYTDQTPVISSDREPNGESNAGDGECDVTDRGNSVGASQSISVQDGPCRRNYLQKGPRIAKVVQPVIYSVEPLEYGTVLPGKLWSTSHAIFPKGYRSRVKYWSIVDPTKMCHYISEVLDGESLGPLFMVRVEECPSETFIQLTASKCWDMVRDKVNTQIRRLHDLNKRNNGSLMNLPVLQPPVDGLEMFGFSTPSIIQAIEALDCDRMCKEYWNCRPQKETSRAVATMDSIRTKNIRNSDAKPNSVTISSLNSLFKKANSLELQALQFLLTNNSSTHSSNLNQEAIALLTEEIKSRHC